MAIKLCDIKNLHPKVLTEYLEDEFLTGGGGYVGLVRVLDVVRVWFGRGGGDSVQI